MAVWAFFFVKKNRSREIRLSKKTRIRIVFFSLITPIIHHPSSPQGPIFFHVITKHLTFLCFCVAGGGAIQCEITNLSNLEKSQKTSNLKNLKMMTLTHEIGLRVGSARKQAQMHCGRANIRPHGLVLEPLDSHIRI